MVQHLEAKKASGEVIDEDALSSARANDELQRRGGTDPSTGKQRPGKAGGGAPLP